MINFLLKNELNEIGHPAREFASAGGTNFGKWIFNKEFGLSVASSGAPQTHSEITGLINGCDPDLLGEGITCTPGSCTSACGVHHRNIGTIRECLEGLRTDDNNISVLWTNAEPLFYCTYNLLRESHDRTSALGLTEQDADALHIGSFMKMSFLAEREYLHSALTAKINWMIVLNIGSIDKEEEK